MLEGCLPEATQENFYSYIALPYLDTLSSSYMYISCICFSYRAKLINTSMSCVSLAPHFS